MAIRADSYGSVAEVLAFTRHLLDGELTFNTDTRPTLTEVEKFIDRASGQLNVALAGRGFSVPITNSIAILSCADWVVARTAEYVELTQRGVGYSDQEGSRTTAFRNLHKSAADFAKESEYGFKVLGVAVGRAKSAGLAFTGMPAQDQRPDRDNTALEQPIFSRHLGDDPTATTFVVDEEVNDD